MGLQSIQGAQAMSHCQRGTDLSYSTAQGRTKGAWVEMALLGADGGSVTELVEDGAALHSM